MDRQASFASWLEARVTPDTLLNDARAGLAAVDGSGVIRHWNRFAETVFGWSSDEAVGRYISELLLLPSVAADVEDRLKSLGRGETWQADLPLKHKDGSRLWVHLTASPVRDDAGVVIGGVAVAFDITDRRRAEERLSLQFDVARVLAEEETLQGAVARLLPAMCETLGSSFGASWAVDPSGPHLECVDTWIVPNFGGQDFRSVTADSIFGLGEGLPGRVWQERKPAWVTDVVADSNFPRAPLAAAAGLHSGFAFPMIGREHFYGVIELFSQERLAPDRKLLEMFTAVGTQFGQFIDTLRAETKMRTVQARRAAILASAFDSVVTIDGTGKVVEFNPAAEEAFGYSRSETIGREMAELIIPPEFRDSHRRGFDHYLATGEGPIIGKRVEMKAMRKNGTIFPVEVAVTPVEMTEDVLFTASIRDITDRKRIENEIADLLDRERSAREAAERATRDLYDLQRITDVALSHLNLDALLDELLDRLTEIFQSDALGILIAGEDGNVLNLRAQRGLDIALGLDSAIPLGQGIAGRIAESDSPVVIGDVLEQEEYRPFFDVGGIRCIIGVPMHSDDRLLGAVMAGSNHPHQLGEREVRLLTLAAQRIGVGISNASDYSREHRIADTLQRSLLPQEVPEVPGMRLAVRYLPGGPGAMVGGDWYDAIPLPHDRIGIALGDVSGKGVRAASLMGQIRSALYSYALIDQGPSVVIENLDRMIQSIGAELFATVVYLDFDPATHEARLANAGHPPPLIRAPDGTSTFVDGDPSPPIGVSAKPEHPEIHLTTEPGSLIVLYSDGLIEDPNSDIERGLKELRRAVETAPADDVEDACDHILSVIFSEREPADDVAIAVMRFD